MPLPTMTEVAPGPLTTAALARLAQGHVLLPEK
jgi:hypothetical protein